MRAPADTRDLARTRVRRHGDAHESAAAVLDDHEQVENAERRRDRHEEIAGDDLARVVAQEGRPTLIAARAPRRGRFGMYLRTVRGETRRPSFSSSSLAIRSSPQIGFSVAIRRISWRSSGGIGGHPCLERRRGYYPHSPASRPWRPRALRVAGDTGRGRTGDDLAWWQGIRLNALPSTTQGVTHAEDDDQRSRTGRTVEPQPEDAPALA